MTTPKNLTLKQRREMYQQRLDLLREIGNLYEYICPGMKIYLIQNGFDPYDSTEGFREILKKQAPELYRYAPETHWSLSGSWPAFAEYKFDKTNASTRWTMARLDRIKALEWCIRAASPWRPEFYIFRISQFFKKR